MTRGRVPVIPRATAALYRDAGWTITPAARPDTGQHTGPCAACRKPTVRYGPPGRPLCPSCGEV